MYKNPYINILDSITRIKEKGRNLFNLLDNYLNLSKSTILDIGCGNGFFEFALAPYCLEVYGLDPSSNMINDAIINNNDHFKYKNVHFLNKYAEELKLDKYPKFNLIIFSYSIHLIKDPIKILNRMKHFLTKDGLIYIMEANKEFISKRFNLKSILFDKIKYNKKQKLLKKTRKLVEEFSKDHVILYELFDNKIYSKLIRFI